MGVNIARGANLVKHEFHIEDDTKVIQQCQYSSKKIYIYSVKKHLGSQRHI